MKNFLYIIFSLLIGNNLTAQNSENSEKFIAPIVPPFSFAGGFGELRNNHFHTGLDFRTGGQIGKPIFAAKSGYISRIGVSPTGYGLAIYMNHADGTTTLYGHLSRLNAKIADYVKEQQYYNETFAIDLRPNKDEFYFNKGEVIAWSGNSGSSGGPHLHFEIRDSETEKALNPIFYNLGITDNSAPKIHSIYLFPISDESSVDGDFIKKRFDITQTKNGISLKNNAIIDCYGEIGFGFQADDLFGGTGMKCGIYSAELKIDNKTEFSFKIKELAFELGRYINSHIDYDEKLRANRWVQRLYKEPGNKLEIYEVGKTSGVINFTDGKTHDIEIIVSDAFGNSSKLNFKILSKNNNKKAEKLAFTKEFKYNEANDFTDENISIKIPLKSLYNDLKFQYSKRNRVANFYSDIFYIHNEYTPVQTPYSLSIKTEGISNSLKNKALIVSLNSFLKIESAVGGEITNDWITAQVRNFGIFAVAVDTVPPQITPLSIKEHKTLINKSKIEFKISDNLSGIQFYRGEIDQKWVLFEFDSKSKTLTHTFDSSKMEFGKTHQLILTVEDGKSNKSTYEATFVK